MLLDNVDKVYSFEVSSKEWYEMLKNRFVRNNWTYIYETDIEKIKSVINGIKDIDIAFVDDGDSRAPLTNFMFHKSSTIIAHDTQYD